MSWFMYFSGLLLGIGIGFSVGMVVFNAYPPNIIPTPEQIEKLENLKHDCTFAEYYYDDNKRALCDIIGVKP